MSSSTILVVYRDEVYLRRVRDALSPAGYEVCAVDSADAVARELQHLTPKVVVLCPCVTPEMQRDIAIVVQQARPGVTILHLNPNHVDRIGELLQ